MSPEVRVTTPEPAAAAAACISFTWVAKRATPGNPESSSGSSFDSPSLLCRIVSVNVSALMGSGVCAPAGSDSDAIIAATAARAATRASGFLGLVTVIVGPPGGM